jgi:predicted SAM-dependent methyltransferase
LALGIFKRMMLSLEIARREKVHIHFGCGDINDKRFINVDARPFSHVHLVSRSPMLSAFPKNSTDTIYACHVFEHLSFHLQPAILRRWLEILRPGGRLMLSVPDFDKLIASYLQNGREVKSIQGKLMGGQNYRGNFHCAVFTRQHLTRMLEECGYVKVSEWHPRDEQAWPQDFSWDDEISLNVLGEKPL